MKAKRGRIVRSSALLAVLVGFLALALARETVKPEDTAKSTGENKSAFGTAAGSRSNSQPVFINLDEPHPNQVFTILTGGADGDKSEKLPERLYSGKKNCVTEMMQGCQGPPGDHREETLEDPN